MKIIIVTYPIGSKSGLSPIQDLIKIFTNIYGKSDIISIVSGGEIINLNARNIEICYVNPRSSFIKKHIDMLTCVLKNALRYNKSIFFFTLGAELLFPSLIALRPLRKKIVLILTGDILKISKISLDRKRPIKLISLVLSAIFADRIIVYSPSFLNTTFLKSFLFKKKIAFAYHHILDSFKCEEGYEDNEIIIGFVGRLVPEKNVVNLVLAIKILVEKYNINTKLIIIGDGPLRKYIEKLIDVLNLHNNIKILGWIPRQALPMYYRKFKILVLPSFAEGLPYTILEAMACGTPILATSVGAIPVVIKEGTTGFLLDSFNAEDIARKIAEILTIKEERLKEVGMAARTYIARKFTIQRVICMWKRILAELNHFVHSLQGA
jgi:glycosyltransferase involved in cell wall biosynthesis